MASPVLKVLALISAASKETAVEGKKVDLGSRPESNLVSVGICIEGEAKVQLMAKMDASGPWLPALAHRKTSTLTSIPFAPYLRADVSERKPGTLVDVRISH
jgi:hypothetical protein